LSNIDVVKVTPQTGTPTTPHPFTLDMLGILDRLSTTSIQKEGLRGLEYTFGDFLAFQHLILYYPAISSVITAAARAKVIRFTNPTRASIMSLYLLPYHHH